MSIAQTLKARKKTHGDYAETADVIQSLKADMRNSPNWDKLTATQKETLEMVQHKVGRVLCGDPDASDHWHDIAGYSTLQEKISAASE
jgi:hypothetical protein